MTILQALIAIASVIGLQVPNSATRLNPSIGRPDPRLYQAVQDSRDWKNPLITIQDEGVQVRANGLVQSRHVPIDRLQQFLIELPVSAWPYGRVVAQSDQGVLPVPADDYLSKEEETRRRAAEILKRLDITVELWPSA